MENYRQLNIFLNRNNIKCHPYNQNHLNKSSALIMRLRETLMYQVQKAIMLMEYK